MLIKERITNRRLRLVAICLVLAIMYALLQPEKSVADHPKPIWCLVSFEGCIYCDKVKTLIKHPRLKQALQRYTYIEYNLKRPVRGRVYPYSVFLPSGHTSITPSNSPEALIRHLEVNYEEGS